jgi:hypothetical protein
MERLLNKLADLHFRLFGSKRLLPLEELCLNAWCKSLGDENKRILDANLKLPTSRNGDGAKVCFYYRESKEIPLFRNTRPALHVATVMLKFVNGTTEQQMKVRIFVHEGRFFSIEFPKRPERYLQLHGMQDKPLDVTEVVIHEKLD